jgi:protein-arginine kinase activator protein McsA
MSSLKEILESLEFLKTKYVNAKDYEKAAKVREVIKLIKEKICNPSENL